MVAELFPRKMSRYAFGMWMLTTMIAGTLGGYVGALTAPKEGVVLTRFESLAVYGHVFMILGVFVAVVAIIIWAIRKPLNRIIESTIIHVAGEGLHGMHEENSILPKT